MDRTIRLLLAVVVIVVAILVLRSNTTVERVIRVSAPYYDVSLEINNAGHFKTWYPGFTESSVLKSPDSGTHTLRCADGRQLSIKAVSPSTVNLTETDGSNTSFQWIAAVPLPDEKQTEIVWAARMPWYKRLYHFFTGRDNVQEGLANLKASIEDPSLRYGFRIQLEPVTDTVILTTSRTSEDTLRNPTLQSLYGTLQSYIGRHHPKGVKDYYYVTSNVVSDKKTEFAIGIPVAAANLPDTGINYLRLPATGRVLTGKGKVGTLAELYNAMNRYANDQGLQKVAQQLEKYSMEPALLPDHPEENVELVFPVY